VAEKESTEEYQTLLAWVRQQHEAGRSRGQIAADIGCTFVEVESLLHQAMDGGLFDAQGKRSKTGWALRRLPGAITDLLDMVGRVGRDERAKRMRRALQRRRQADAYAVRLAETLAEVLERKDTEAKA